MRSSDTPNDYWMTLDAKDLATMLLDQHDRYFISSMNPIYQMWVRNTYAYYSTIMEAQSWYTALNYMGELGELVKMSIPQARTLVRQTLTLTTKQRLAFNAIAQVSDSDVNEEVRIANAIAEHLVSAQNVDIKSKYMVENGLVIGTGFMSAVWRSDKGNPRVVKTDETGAKQVLYDGDVEIRTHHVTDLLYNFAITDWDQHDWVEVRVKRNRWSLIAEHPELAQQIKNLPSCSRTRFTRDYMGFSHDDTVYVYELYHRPMPALPKGRMLYYSDPLTIYYDDINHYEGIPIEQFKPEPIETIGFGYPMLSNLLPSQEMYDHEYSCLATNHSSLGVQNVAIPRGADVDVNELYGMNFMSYTPQNIPGGGRPEPLNLVQSSPEIFKMGEALLSNMQGMSNINAAVRGELSAGTSGVAIATLTTNALEFLSSYSECMTLTLEKVMMWAVVAYRKFAKVERQIRLTGKNYQVFNRPFTGDMLSPIVAMKMQTINPMMQTMAGRIDLADKTAATGMITDLQQYVGILNGEPVTTMFAGDLSRNDYIKTENEALMSGKPVMAISIEDHAKHIYEHATLLNDPETRLNSPRVQAIMQHIMQHYQLSQATDPTLVAMATTGKTPMVPPGAPPPGGAPPGQNMAEAIKPPLPAGEPAQPAKDMLGRAG